MAIKTTRPGEASSPNISVATPEDDARTILINEINWGAVLAGAAMALALHLILNMLGIAAGAASFSVASNTGNPSAEAVSLTAALWWTIAGILASFLGGLAAGRLSGAPKTSTAGWHGLISWAFTTLVIFYVITATAGTIVGGAAQAVSSMAGGVARTAGGAIQTTAQAVGPSMATSIDPMACIEQRIRQAMGGQDPAALRDAAVSAVRAAITSDQGEAAAARERAAEALARAQNIPVDQAKAQVAEYETQYRKAVDTAREQAKTTGEAARKAISRGSLVAAIALLIGAIAAWYGGSMGVVDPTITRGVFWPRT